MSPVSVKTSRSTRALESGEAKLWVVLVGVNHYADAQLSDLAYPALDCQGLGGALNTATAAFPQKSIVLHHDHPQASDSSPDLAGVRTSLQQIVEQAQPPDTLLFIFQVMASLTRRLSKPFYASLIPKRNSYPKRGCRCRNYSRPWPIVLLVSNWCGWMLAIAAV